MSEFPKFRQDEFPKLYIEQTDKELAKQINPNFRYTHFKTIAKGGKSLIQSCRDQHLGRVICYKSLLPEFADDPIEQKRLLREARVSAMLQHPNTMPTYELGRDRKGHYYFTMKLVHGYTFREIIDYRERYDVSQLVEIVIQVAHALEYAHAHGVVHRDIKPANILVGPFGEVLLLDWGLAKVRSETGLDMSLGESTAASAVLDKNLTGFQKLQGSVCYMSPEQINKDADIDGRTDIYSLGAVLYEALTGELTTDGETVREAMDNTLNVMPPRPSDILKIKIPSVIEETVMQCLVKDKNKRLQSAGEMIRLLKQ